MILDHQGNEIQASSYGGGGGFDQQLSSWMPMLTSPDDEVLSKWETSVGRLRDLIDENGITSGAVQSQLDNVIGPGLKLVPKPDWRALGLSREWTEEFQEQVESAWQEWAFDPDFRCHSARILDFTGLMQQGYRSFMTTGEIMSVADWIPRPSWSFRTAMQPIDPERVSNPHGLTDTVSLRGGVQKDDRGSPIAYHVREAHPNSMLGTARRFSWKTIRRETAFGRRNFIHIFDQRRPGQTRGQTSMLAGIKQVKMLERWQNTSLQAAIINSMYAAVIESSMDHPAVLEALGQGGENPISKYLTSALSFHSGTSKVQWDGSKIAHLFPGEKLNMLKAEQPVAAFESFEAASLRNLAASWNTSYEQLSRDYSKTNYSSARASMLEAWKFIVGERQRVGSRYANEQYSLFLEDAIDSGRISLPANAPNFYAPGAKRAYTRADWIGPGREHIDPERGEKATRLALANATTTLEKECAARGLDWREVLEQRKREKAEIEAAGLSFPDVFPEPEETTDPDREETETDEREE